MDMSRRGFLKVTAAGVGISGLGFDLRPPTRSPLAGILKDEPNYLG